MAGHSTIHHVGFSPISDDEATRESNAEITNYELFSPNGPPVSGGVYDLRLGPTDIKYPCLTCVQGRKACPGHRGHMPLRFAVESPIAIPEIRRWLRVACLKCGALVVDVAKYASIPAARRLTEAATAVVDGAHCGRCGAVHPRITKDDEDHFTYWAEPPGPAGEKRGARAGRGEKRGEKLYPDILATIFGRISTADVEALGRPATSHPSRFIRKVLSFAPNTIRPGVRSFGGAGSSYHDSTNLLQHYVKRNSQMPKTVPEAMRTLGAGPVDGELDRSVQNLRQINYDLIMGSSSTSVTQGSGGRRGLVVGARAVRSFLRNQPRKEGRIRGHLLGSRVLFISRSTISGNSNYSLDQVGIPLEFARILQVEEVVQEYNKEFLLPFFLNGRRQYPGCTYVRRRATREVHDVINVRDESLEVGDVLFRDLIDGDVVYFNRQPTLERSSFGLHRAVIIQDPAVHTFQFNVSACEWYNADFDGDQMNLWAPRGAGPRAEAIVLSSVANSFISTKTGGPVNGQVQDSTVGSAELTRTGVLIDKYHAMSLFATAGGDPPRFDADAPGHLYTGRDIVSLLGARAPINYRRQPSSFSDVYAPFIPYDKSETLTVIEQGTLVQGVLDKKAIGAKASGGVFHLISREYGAQRALDMIFALQQIALQFLRFRGFTVSTADLLPNPEALEQIRALVSSVVLEADVITGRLLRGEIVPPIDSTVHEFYERMQREALKVNESEILRWVLGSIRPDTNGFFRMIAVGSKGNNPNFIHVSGVIGQTTINGERIAEQFAFRRTSPYFPRFATDPAAYGFVANSYMTGMRTSEFIFQDMNGRFDLINKALSTASTGYFMRKGVMNNQSSIVDNHRRVMKDTKVVQFIYGEDGLDSRELEKVDFSFVLLGDEALRAAAGLDLAAAGATGDGVAEAQRVIDTAVAKIIEDRDEFRRVFSRVEYSNFGDTFSTDILMPVNVRRIIDGAFIDAKLRAKSSGGPAEPAPVTAPGMRARVERVWDLCARIPYALVNEIQERARAPIARHRLAAASLLCILIRAELNPKTLSRLSDEQLGFIIDAIRQRYCQSLIDYGTAVGVLAAQAISEPLTQYMLDSHHRSVAGGTNKSGLIRVTEIYGALPVSKERSASMLLPLRPEATAAGKGSSAAFAIAQEIANSIEYVTLRRFTRRFDVLLEPVGALVYPPFAGDRAWIDEFGKTHPLIQPPGDLTNWCIRVVLDKAALVLKAVDLELIVRRLRARHPGTYVVHTPEAVHEVTIRIWHRAAQFKRDADPEDRARVLLDDILDTPIRGINGVMRASAEKIYRRRVAVSGDLVDETTKIFVSGAPQPGQKTRPAAVGELVKEERYAISTVGTNLYQALLHGSVDSRCAISSSIGDTLKLYGIEAARAKIVSETRAFMEDNTPNLRHLYLYADEMTRTGRVTSVERSGLGAREHNNVLLRMAYGAPIQVVTDATLAGAKCRVYGIAAPQLLGSVPQVGSIYNSLTVDEEFVRKNVKSVDSILDELGRLA